MKKIIPYCALVSLILLQACSGDNEENGEKIPLVLTKSTRILTRSAGELQTFLGTTGLDLPYEEIRYEVTMHEVEYTTTYKGESITASGLVFIPNTTDEVSMMSFQHGTIAADREAPSNLAVNDTELIFYSGMSALGFVTVVPDFIGFGASGDIMHPYFIEDATATAVIDNLYAAANLAEEEGVNLDNELYLAGYSQGGYATMATHKGIEEQGIAHFQLQASFPASGGYDMIGVRSYFFEQETYHEPFFLAFVAMAFDTRYDFTQGMDVFFNEPYASRIPDLFDGSLSGSQINDQLTDVVADLVKADYLTDPNAEAFDFATEAFEENSLIDWIPSIPMHMYHGDADITVPYQNSVDVYNHFITEGATVVTFTSIPDGTHGTGVGPYIEGFIAKLMEYEAD